MRNQIEGIILSILDVIMRFHFFSFTLAASLLGFALCAHAEPAAILTNLAPAHPWSLELGLGLGRYQAMESSDGDTALGRIGIGKNVINWKRLRAGIETAFQTGNDARVSAPSSVINAMGGLPIDTVMKSTLDLLLTGKFYPEFETPVFLLMKGGVILRRW